MRQRVALVTGGTRGIGKGIAAALGREGARLAIAYRSNKAAAQNTLRELQASGAEGFAIETDVTEPSKATFLVETVAERYGRLDILVNNVGEFRWRLLAESSLEEWEEILDSNLLSVLYVSKAALPTMRRQRWGRIINLGAVGAERAFGQAKISAYAAAKAAVVAFSRSLAIEGASAMPASRSDGLRRPRMWPRPSSSLLRRKRTTSLARCSTSAADGCSRELRSAWRGMCRASSSEG